MKVSKKLILFATAVLIAGCSSNKTEESSVYSAADSASIDYPASDPSQKLVKTASMDFKVSDVNKSSRLISDKARSLGGMVMNLDIESMENSSKTIKLSEDSVLLVGSYTTRAVMNVRVPSLHLEEFINEVNALSSYLNNSKLQIDDKSVDYIATQLKQQSREKLLKDAGDKAVKSREVTDLIARSDEMIDQKAATQRIDHDVKYSMVALSFYQNESVRKEKAANGDLSAYRQPFYNRFTDALEYGWYFLLEIVIALSNLWAILLLAAAIWFIYRYLKTRNKLILHPKEN